MNFPSHSRSVVAAGLLLLTAHSAGFAQQAARSASGPNRPDIEQIVKKYILEHPEVVLESVRLFQEREQAAQKQRAKEAVVAHMKDLHDPSSPSLGPVSKAADAVTVVAFFDYRCGYCKKVDDKLAKLAATPGVRVVYKDFPILGPESILAAEAALAAAKQDAYHKFHQALMTSGTPITSASIEQIATELKLDVGKLRQDMASAEVKAALTKNYELAGALNVQSTPTFVIGTETVSGALTDEAFEAAIEKARGASKTAQVHSRGARQ